MPPAELNTPRSTAAVRELRDSFAASLPPPAALAVPGVSSGRRSVVTTGVVCGGIDLRYRLRRRRMMMRMRAPPPKVSQGRRKGRKRGQELGFGGGD